MISMLFCVLSKGTSLREVSGAGLTKPKPGLKNDGVGGVGPPDGTELPLG